MQQLFSFLLFSLIALTTMAQRLPGTIDGTVKDAKNDLIPGATVRLLKASDSSIVSSEITNAYGKYHFSKVPGGSYLLAVTAMGQKKFIGMATGVDEAHPVIMLPVIVLLPAKTASMAEVIVTAKRPLIEQEIDKTIVNVGSMISSATSNTLEVLEKTPGVTVTSNGEITLNGRGGILVLIDGRSTYMSGSDLTAYLKSLPGSLLEKIEADG